MNDAPNYSFYRKPRFSANHLAEYLCTRDAAQRDAVIRKAKFPRKPSVIAYQQVTPAIRAFLTSNSRDLSQLNALAERLATKAQREEGYNRDEALRCGAAIDAFTTEPLPVGHPLASAPNLLLTPHQASFGFDTGARVSTAAAQAIVDLKTGRRPQWVVNPEVFDAPSLRAKLSE